MKKKVWLGVFITGICLYFFYLSFKDIGFYRVWEELKKVRYFYIFLFVLAQLFIYVLRAQRWRHILEPIKPVGFSRLLKTTFIGFMANNIFPLRMGELVKAYLIGRQEGISKSSSMATIVVERVFDLLAVMIFLAVSLYTFPFPANSQGTLDILRHGSYVMVAALGVAIVGIVLLIAGTGRIIAYLDNKTSGRDSEKIKKIVGIINAFARGLDSLKKSRHLLNILALSMGIWLVMALNFYLAYLAFNLDLSFLSAMMLTAVVALGVALPSTPGFVGTFEVACSSFLALLSVQPDKAAGYTLVVHAASLIPVTVIGLFLVLAEKISFSELGSLKRNAETENS